MVGKVTQSGRQGNSLRKQGHPVSKAESLCLAGRKPLSGRQSHFVRYAGSLCNAGRVTLSIKQGKSVR